VLDLGCGCGALALQLRGYLLPERGGEYIGVDIHQPSIRWCQRALAGPGFTFVWFNAYSAAFNPSGERAFDYQAALAPFQPVNVAVAKSLFTHLRPETCLAYLQAVRRVLAPEGAFLFSAFTYASESDLASAEIAFRFGEGCFRHAYAQRVESAVAFDERWLKDALSEAGFALDAFYPGAWRASGDGLSFQDIFVARSNG
jgi:cyclopropane fatty-acyl-phospholipid synthase-like methyltransferase